MSITFKTFTECLKLLGVSPKAEKEEIQQAYYSLAKKYHPDINPDQKSQEIFSRIKEAYEFVLESKQTKYNQFMDNLGQAKEEYYAKRSYYEQMKEKHKQKQAKTEGMEIFCMN